MLNGFLLVALGGALGAMLRYGTGLAFGNGAQATLFVNIVGSFSLGLLTAWGVSRDYPAENAIWLLVGIGLLGAFTTFSAFSRETIYMLMNGDYLRGLMYAGANMVGALGAFAAGLFALRKLLG